MSIKPFLHHNQLGFCHAGRFFSSGTPHNRRIPQLVFLGAPGVGKGTFAALLSKKWGIPHISTGDIIRAEISSGSSMGKEFKSITTRGDLVPDSLVIDIAAKRLKAPDTKDGVILDGFPRTVVQAEALDKLSGSSLAVDISLPRGILVAKLSGRRVCGKCGKTYNVSEIQEPGYEMAPLLPTAADIQKCSSCALDKLVQRSDDNADVILKRLMVYEEETAPLAGYYKAKKCLEEFHVRNGVKDFPQFELQIRKAGTTRGLY